VTMLVNAAKIDREKNGKDSAKIASVQLPHILSQGLSEYNWMAVFLLRT
jgi:hypothetical protein